MATLTIKKLPDKLYRQLRASAEQNRRSMNSEAIVRLEQALGSQPRPVEELLARARELRKSVSGHFLTDAELTRIKRAGRS